MVEQAEKRMQALEDRAMGVVRPKPPLEAKAPEADRAQALEDPDPNPNPDPNPLPLPLALTLTLTSYPYR